MAATRIMSIHINKGKTARQCIGERLDYIMNPKKTDGRILIAAYACSPETAADEFMLFRQEYQQNTGRTQENEVMASSSRTLNGWLGKSCSFDSGSSVILSSCAAAAVFAPRFALLFGSSMFVFLLVESGRNEKREND